jgi:hypothetical protein
MKKFFQMVEDLWVAVAFAEAGEYESLRIQKEQLRQKEVLRVHA